MRSLLTIIQIALLALLFLITLRLGAEPINEIWATTSVQANGLALHCPLCVAQTTSRNGLNKFLLSSDSHAIK
jgi:hypothetical protein